MSNSTAIVDREIASGRIEGVDFGPRVWVIARSPTAVLLWVFGQSQSINGFGRYYQPHLTILPDRSPSFIYNPTYRSLRHDWTRLTTSRLMEFKPEICEAFDSGGAFDNIWRAVDRKQTAIFEGGGGPLLPLKCRGAAYRDWLRNGGGFIVRPEGVTEHETLRGKLGWKPTESGS